MISVRGLTKQYGAVRAVDDLTFDVEPGRVTGFLGPNGAGKSTTMRIVMGLDRPTAGTALVGGRSYAEHSEPLREVGALLDAGAMHPGRTGRSHLRIGARSNGLPLTRVDEVIERVGLGAAARRRIKGYSLGMRQRLGIAAALLGNPAVLLFDEPVNGLDLDGVRWIRALLRRLADEGRTVLVSSHLMSEMQLIADKVIIIGRGRLIADSAIEEFLGSLGSQRVRVRTAAPDDLIRGVSPRAASVVRSGPDEVVVEGLSSAEIGTLAHELGVPVHHLAEIQQSLEQAYLRLTEDGVDYHGSTEPAAAAEDGAGR
jgi:ABC-2 type transport system ATP-binding protein